MPWWVTDIARVSRRLVAVFKRAQLCRPRVDCVDQGREELQVVDTTHWLLAYEIMRLIRRRLLDVVDHKYVHRAFRRRQFQAKLFLQSRKDRRAVWIDVDWWRAKRELRQLIRRPGQFEVPQPAQFRVV